MQTSSLAISHIVVVPNANTIVPAIFEELTMPQSTVQEPLTVEIVANAASVRNHTLLACFTSHLAATNLKNLRMFVTHVTMKNFVRLDIVYTKQLMLKDSMKKRLLNQGKVSTLLLKNLMNLMI